MDDVVGTIEERIRADRRALEGDIRELGDRAQAALDWRRQYHAHAGAVLAVAFGGGVLLGALSRGGNGTTTSDEIEYSSSATPRRSMLSAIDPSGRARGHVGQVVEDIIDAFVGLAGAAAVKYVGDVVPGFTKEYESRSRHPL